eukprot:4321214-Prorocentrum_lima.AAC.1
MRLQFAVQVTKVAAMRRAEEIFGAQLRKQVAAAEAAAKEQSERVTEQVQKELKMRQESQEAERIQ